MTAPRRVGKLVYAIGPIVIAWSCAKAEDSPLADQGGHDDGGGKGGTAAAGGSGGAGAMSGSGGKGGSSGTATGGAAGKGGSTSTGGKGGSTSTGGKGGSAGSPSTTYGCLDGEGGQGGQGGAPGQAGAGGAGPETLFTDDFEDGDADGWTSSSGDWEIVDDDSSAYEQSDAGSTRQYVSAFGGTCWADQIVEARVKIVNFNGNSTSNAAGLFARYVSEQTHYLVGMNSGNNGELFIARRVQSTSNAPDRIATKTNMRWARDTWYTLRLEVVGSSLKAYLDGNLALETEDTRITSGGVAVGARHVHVRFDDVRVTAP